MATDPRPGARRLWGLLAEFETAGQLLEAARSVRDQRYTRWDCHTPFPVHGLDEAMGLRDTRLPWVVLGAGAAGAVAGFLMQTWMNAIDYPLIVSGKPLVGIPAQVPIAFELTILFGALAAFVSMFAFNGLPRFYHPTFRNRAFARVTTDRFFLVIEAADPRFDVEASAELLRSLGSRRVEWLRA